MITLNSCSEAFKKHKININGVSKIGSKGEKDEK